MQIYKLFPAGLLLIATAACSSPPTNVTMRDEQGRYVTSSDFRKMERSEFVAAIEAGLSDFDDRLAELRQRANKLGGEHLAEFADCNEDLMESRQEVVNELERTQAALADSWPDRREETLEAYYELRNDLDEAYEEVLES